MWSFINSVKGKCLKQTAVKVVQKVAESVKKMSEEVEDSSTTAIIVTLVLVSFLFGLVKN